MPYLTTTVNTVPIEHAAEVRRLLTEHVAERRARGETMMLYRQLFPTAGLRFRISAVYDSLAAYEKWRDGVFADPSNLAFNVQVAKLSSSPFNISMFESLVPPQPGDPPRFIREIGYRPAVGKMRDLRALLIDFVKDRQQSGLRTILRMQVGTSDAPPFIATTALMSLAEVDTFRQAFPNDAKLQAWIAKLDPLLAANVEAYFWERLT